MRPARVHPVTTPSSIDAAVGSDGAIREVQA